MLNRLRTALPNSNAHITAVSLDDSAGSAVQVDFAADLDLLLRELVRVASGAGQGCRMDRDAIEQAKTRLRKASKAVDALRAAFRPILRRWRTFLHAQKLGFGLAPAEVAPQLNPGVYLLYCTSDEKVWTGWRVKPAARAVRGPSRLFQDIAPPDGY